MFAQPNDSAGPEAVCGLADTKADETNTMQTNAQVLKVIAIADDRMLKAGAIKKSSRRSKVSYTVKSDSFRENC